MNRQAKQTQTMLTFPQPKQLASAFSALLACCIIACGNGASVQNSKAGDVQGAWKVTGTEEAKGLSDEQSGLVGMVGLLDPDNGDRKHLFTKEEYIVSDASGKELHRWPYKLEGSWMVIGDDTATVKWTDANSFTLIADSVFVHYKRLLNTGQ